MDRESPVSLWVVLSVGVVLVGGVYAVAQRAAVQPQASPLIYSPSIRHTTTDSAPSAERPITTITRTVSQQLTTPSASTSTVNSSEVDLVVGSNATFLVEDSIGRRAGKQTLGNDVLQEIPQSAYFEDSIGNAETGQAGISVSHQVQIVQPVEGPYSGTLIGLQPGSYDLVVRAFSIDGNSEPYLEDKGSISREARITFELDFRSAPGAISTLTKLT